MKNIRTDSIVLKRVSYGEYDKIVTALTPMGVESFIVRGARKERSKLASAIELFSVSDIVIVKRQYNSLGILTQGRLKIFYENIIRDYNRLTLGYEILKDIENNVNSEDGASDWFSLLNKSLQYLNNVELSLCFTQAFFYLNKEKLLGYELNLWRNEDGSKLKDGRKYCFDFSARAFREDIKGEYSVNDIKIMRLLVSDRPDIVKNINNIESSLKKIVNLLQQYSRCIF